MKKIVLAAKWQHIVALIFMFASAVWLTSRGVVIDADSTSYITKSAFRSPIYPLAIHFSEVFFGSGVYWPVIFTQLLLVIIFTYLLADLFNRKYQISSLGFLLITVILFVPYLKWGNFLLSQGIAYPLFLCSSYLLFRALFNKNIKSLLAFIGTLALLILTRRQFVFMYVVAVFAIAYFAYFYRISLLKIAILVLASLGSWYGADVAERSYHYHFNQQFSTVPFLGLQLIVTPLYLASAEDAELFKNPIEKAIFTDAYATMQKNCWNADCECKGSTPSYHHYYLQYNDIGWRSLWPAALNHTGGDLVLIDKILVKMSFVLIAQHWQRWTHMYFCNIINNIGGYYFGVLLVLSFLWSGFYHLKNRDNFSLGLFFALLISFGNYTLVALVEPAMAVYNFYSNTILITFFIILMHRTLRVSDLVNKNRQAFS